MFPTPASEPTTQTDALPVDVQWQHRWGMWSDACRCLSYQTACYLTAAAAGEVVLYWRATHCCVTSLSLLCTTPCLVIVKVPRAHGKRARKSASARAHKNVPRMRDLSQLPSLGHPRRRDARECPNVRASCLQEEAYQAPEGVAHDPTAQQRW